MSNYTVESFNTGTRQTVSAADWQSALDSVQGDQFTILKMPDGRYMAGCNENSVMPVAGGHYADTPEAAAASLREHYRAILTTKPH